MHDEYSKWWSVPAIVIPAVVPAVIPAPAYAVQYLTLEQAQQALFPEAGRFVARPLRLTEEQARVVEKYARVRMRGPEQPVWRVEAAGRHLGWFVLDEVYGKHEFITYAVALDASGAVMGVEILDYRETHGGEVRQPAWRAQFTGKRYGAGLKLGEEIRNISGATLSCKHISEGVRRVLALHQVALK
jgi:Na+-translocating ferredoxin:NAD+ oxidoreductase RnfG subunit